MGWLIDARRCRQGRGVGAALAIDCQRFGRQKRDRQQGVDQLYAAGAERAARVVTDYVVAGQCRR